jgi:hypothetical protein
MQLLFIFSYFSVHVSVTIDHPQVFSFESFHTALVRIPYFIQIYVILYKIKKNIYIIDIKLLKYNIFSRIGNCLLMIKPLYGCYMGADSWKCFISQQFIAPSVFYHAPASNYYVTRIRDDSDSNLCRGTDCTDWDVSWLFSVPTEKYQDSNLN